MLQLFLGSIILSLLHAVLPNHWLPLLAVGRRQNWTTREITWVAFLCGCAHALSTVLVGLALGLLGVKLSSNVAIFSGFIAPMLLVLIGVYFIYQHHRHHHFHIHHQAENVETKTKIVAVLTVAMFLSPCLEIEGYFLVAGRYGIFSVFAIALIYIVLSIGGMVLWIRWAFTKSVPYNWHSLEHRAGIITGVTLIITGIISFFVS